MVKYVKKSRTNAIYVLRLINKRTYVMFDLLCEILCKMNKVSKLSSNLTRVPKLILIQRLDNDLLFHKNSLVSLLVPNIKSCQILFQTNVELYPIPIATACTKAF